MLLNFSVTNYGCIKERQTLSLEAKITDDNISNNIFLAPLKHESEKQLIRSLVMYGPNASGKSTLIKALAFLEKFVLTSHKQQIGDQIGEDLEVTPFKLSADTLGKSSEFEINLIASDGVRYIYGVACTSSYVTEEWLFAYFNARPQKLFHRVYDTATQQYAYKYSKAFNDAKVAKERWQQETKNNELFLSKTVQANSQQFFPVFNWFKDTLRIIDAFGLPRGYTKKICHDNLSIVKKVVSFMQHADLDIADIKVTKESIEPKLHVSDLPDDMPLIVKKAIIEDLNTRPPLTHYEVNFLHRAKNSAFEMQLEEEEESQGTQAMFKFAGPWLDLIEDNLVLIVDELDTSLHPLVVHQLIKLFHQETQANNKQAQLIFTTHDSSLLSQGIFRRDQIWFLEKNNSGATELYSLDHIKGVRADTSHEKPYLNGRYGGIPFMKDLSN
jgi:uncharacterized protein